MTEAHLYALGLALACLAGVRAYLTVLGVGLAGLAGWVDLPTALQVTTSPWVLCTAGALTVVEFFADKIPGVDSGWDLLQTLLRIPVGAFLTAATLSGDGQLGAGALVAGGAVALLAHGVKASTRVAINASPEPVSNIGASLTEDVVVAGGIGLAFSYPWLALGLVLGTLLTMAMIVAWLVRFIIRKIRGIDASSASRKLA